MIEQIIDFLEQYWGYSIVGGVTVGTIITFIITQVKSLVSSSTFKKLTNNVVSNLKEQYSEAIKLLDELKTQTAEKHALYDELMKVRAEQQKANEYYNQVQAAQFKAFSYIIMASKLTEGDKLELLAEFEKLKLPEAPVIEVPVETENSFDKQLELAEAQQEIVKEQIITTAEAIETTVEKAKTLFEKYTKEK